MSTVMASDKKARARLYSRYLKDLSFENLGAPVSLNLREPDIKVAVQIKGEHRGNLYEIVLIFSATAEHEAKPIWVIEISYAGLFEITDVDDADRRRFVFAEAPRLLFPWVERVISDVTRDGGLPTLNLTQPDFYAMYREKYPDDPA